MKKCHPPVFNEFESFAGALGIFCYHSLLVTMDEKQSYPAASIPDEFKNVLAGLYKGLHERGVTKDDFLECLEIAGYTVGSSTLDRWVAHLGTRGSVILENKKTGSDPCLDREQRCVASGWVLHENEHGKIVSLAAFSTFIMTYFTIKLSYPTISRYLDEDGFACRLVQKKSKSTSHIALELGLYPRFSIKIC